MWQQSSKVNLQLQSCSHITDPLHSLQPESILARWVGSNGDELALDLLVEEVRFCNLDEGWMRPLHRHWPWGSWSRWSHVVVVLYRDIKSNLDHPILSLVPEVSRKIKFQQPR